MTSLLGGVGHRNTMKEVLLLILSSYLSVDGVVGSGITRTSLSKHILKFEINFVKKDTVYFMITE